MTVTVDDQTYYRISEACAAAGISRSTLLRWFRLGTFEDVECRDRRGWRLFSKRELDDLIAEAKKLQKISRDGTSIPVAAVLNNPNNQRRIDA